MTFDFRNDNINGKYFKELVKKWQSGVKKTDQ